MTRRYCAECTHYGEDMSALTLSEGVCRRYPPKVHVLPNFKVPLVAHVPVSPDTPACGEFSTPVEAP
jgi:hypothetical protein